ncbi:MAG TPA: acetolactate synthase large subunit [Gammaproteobacteria bacterium]|nr:acetolactate synthase large subunit [Gammaproteobacteria bacterium]
MKAAELLVRALEAEGVHCVFGVPGEENLDVLEALRESAIRFIPTRHEQAAGFMAATWGRLTGEPGVCLSTLGPGATNLVTAAAYATLGAMPMVMITGQKPIKTNKQAHFQIVDVVDMMQPLTKYSRQVVSGASLAALVREAFRVSAEERPGATHLELPEDIARETVSGDPLPRSQRRRPVAEQKAVARAVAAIESAQRPLLMIGAGANRKRTSRMLRRFVDDIGIPFFTTQMGKGVVDERHALFVGNAALSDHDYVHRAIDHSDLVINVGHDVVEKPPFFMHEDDERSVVHINFSPAEIDPVYFPQIEVVGDIANAVWQLCERVRPQAHWDFTAFRTVRTRLLEDIADQAADERFPIYPQRLVDSVRRALPSNGIVALDNGIYKIWFARNYLAHEPNTVLLDNALASMGAGLPSALAARMSCPDSPVVAVCGDGGFMMNAQELETAVRLGLHVVILILRDGAYGMIRWKQQELGFKDYGMEFGNPDFVVFAQAHGAAGHRPESAAELDTLLGECLATPGVHLIDVPIDYADNDRMLHHEIPARSGRIHLG